jgi:uncharacterized membrane-anchored protein
MSQPKTGPNTEPSKPKKDMSEMILDVSLRMVGMTLTISGIFRAIQTVGKKNLAVDNIMAVVAVAYLASWIFALFTQRCPADSRLRQALELVTDGVFMLAVILMIGALGLIAFEVI